MDSYLTNLIYLYEDIISNNAYNDINDIITSFKIYLSRFNLNNEDINQIIFDFFNNNYMNVEMDVIENIMLPDIIHQSPINIFQNFLNNYHSQEEILESKNDDIIDGFNELPNYYNNDDIFDDLTELDSELDDLDEINEETNPINSYNINMNNFTDIENEIINIFNNEINNHFNNYNIYRGADADDIGRAGRRNGFNLGNIFNMSVTYHYEPELHDEYKDDDVVVVLNDEEFKNIKKYNNKDEDLNCCICCDDIEINDEISELNCGHKFHTECIEKLLKQYSNKCPVCRQECGSSKYINV